MENEYRLSILCLGPHLPFEFEREEKWQLCYGCGEGENPKNQMALFEIHARQQNEQTSPFCSTEAPLLA